MRPALDPIHENQPVIAVEDDNDSGNDTLTSKSTVKENKAKEEVRGLVEKPFCLLMQFTDKSLTL